MPAAVTHSRISATTPIRIAMPRSASYALARISANERTLSSSSTRMGLTLYSVGVAASMAASSRPGLARTR